MRSHDLATAIMGEKPMLEDTNRLRATIKQLEANRHENDPNWWNNLAGARLRLNEPQTAVTLLEPIAGKFPDDYGIHANLGTAYHLLGRYADAEKEIARDLKINPNAHFGLEKYHLALLQYLVRESNYRSRHVYVDEYTARFLMSRGGWSGSMNPHLYNSIPEAMAEDYTNNVAAAEADYAAMLKTNKNDGEIWSMLGTVAAVDPKPPYRAKWNLDTDTNFEAGVIYMAQMNPKEPACFVMLGIAAWRSRAYHLAATAFEKAIALGSPQSELLKERADGLNEYIRKSRQNDPTFIFGLIGAAMALPILYYIYAKIRDRRRVRAMLAA